MSATFWMPPSPVIGRIRIEPGRFSCSASSLIMKVSSTPPPTTVTVPLLTRSRSCSVCWASTAPLNKTPIIA